MTLTAPPPPTAPPLRAPSHWRCLDFISDLHLQASDEPSFVAWAHYLQTTPADAVFILGDWFEVWVGDDVLTSDDLFAQRCAAVARSASQRLALYAMHGNRDFLLGPLAMQAFGAQWLADPTVLHFAGRQVLLSHGDALCLGDVEYQRFRSLVRSDTWRQDFLAKPLAERREIARGLRDGSQARKRSGQPYADVDTETARAWLDGLQCDTLVHGHTHAPQTHVLGADRQRVVLSDWDATATPPRAQVLRWQSAAPGVFERINLLP